MNIDYYQQQQFNFLEIAIALQKFHYRSEGKFYIPAITPLISSGAPKDSKKNRIATTNILNYNSKLAVQSFTLSNFIPLRVPRYMCDETIIDESGYISEGAKFLISFVGGDINKPRIVGVY